MAGAADTARDVRNVANTAKKMGINLKDVNLENNPGAERGNAPVNIPDTQREIGKFSVTFGKEERSLDAVSRSKIAQILSGPQVEASLSEPGHHVVVLEFQGGRIDGPATKVRREAISAFVERTLDLAPGSTVVVHNRPVVSGQDIHQLKVIVNDAFAPAEKKKELLSPEERRASAPAKKENQDEELDLERYSYTATGGIGLGASGSMIGLEVGKPGSPKGARLEIGGAENQISLRARLFKGIDNIGKAELRAGGFVQLDHTKAPEFYGEEIGKSSNEVTLGATLGADIPVGRKNVSIEPEIQAGVTTEGDFKVGVGVVAKYSLWSGKKAK